MKKHWLEILSISLSLIILMYFLWPYPASYLQAEQETLRIYDRSGEILMELTPGRSGFIDALPLESYPGRFIDLVLFSEDRHFYRHAGISLRAIARALWQNIRSGQTLSGGSTITQQLVKYKNGRFRNSFFSKILELAQAVRLDLHYSKEDILEYYLNHIFMGYRNQGFNQAAHSYFGKDIQNINDLEMAALIQLIKGPSLYDIYHRTAVLEQRARDLLQSAYEEGILSPEYYELSLEQHLEIVSPKMSFTAPHFCLWVLEQARRIVPRGQAIAELHTTLDAELYRSCLSIARGRLSQLTEKMAGQSSILILDNRSGDILSMMGSVDWYAEDGQINGVTMKRQPGSSMKAFTYALALESGHYHLSSILPDIPSDFPAMVGKYIPRNYDERFHGPVRLAVALGSSYNVPAVYLAHRIGIRKYFSTLKDLGFDSLLRSPQYYGLGLTLGNADVSLLELTRAYMSLGNRGMWKDIQAIDYIVTTQGKVIRPPSSQPRQVFSPHTAMLISHVLEDFRYKAPAYGATSPLNLPWPVSVKTGTTKDFRDNTVEAYTGELTIGIWTGNFSGQAMKDLPSARGAGLILRDLLLELYNQGYHHSPAFSETEGGFRTLEVCSLSGDLAGPYCSPVTEYFAPGAEPRELCGWHQPGGILLPPEYREWGQLNLADRMTGHPADQSLLIVSPSQGDTYQIDSLMDIRHQMIRLSAQGPEPIHWTIDGAALGQGKELYWQLSPGIHWIEARHKDLSSRVKIVVVEE